MIDPEKTLEDLQLLNALCHGTVLDDAIALLKELDTVEHAKEVLCRNGWEKMRYPDGMICKWDDPEIVRCKDCKWNSGKPNIPYCQIRSEPHRNDWYCADGERRTDDA